MVIGIKESSLVDRFNKFFAGSAKAVINGNRLEITINGATLIMSLPEVTGTNAMGQS